METQKKSFNVNARHAGAFVVFVCALVGSGIAARELDSGQPGAESVSAPRESVTQGPSALVYVTPPTLSKKQAAAALSYYLDRVRLILRHLSMLHGIHMSGLQQAVQRTNQEQFRKKAESMKAASKKARDALFALPIPEDLSEQDADRFEDIQIAALGLAIAFLEMDVVVNADFGINRIPDLTKQLAAIECACHDFDSRAKRTLEYLGFLPKLFDRRIIVVKPSDFPRGPSLKD